VGPRAVLDAVVKRKIPSPRRESNLRIPDLPARSLDKCNPPFCVFANRRKVLVQMELSVRKIRNAVGSYAVVN
jgi:hypothetical protein